MSFWAARYALLPSFGLLGSNFFSGKRVGNGHGYVKGARGGPKERAGMSAVHLKPGDDIADQNRSFMQFSR
jgi:hypothetical protein